MINNIILDNLMNKDLLITASILGIDKLDWAGVTAILGGLAIVAGAALKIFEKPDDNFKEKIDILEIDFKEYKKEVKEEFNRIIHKINEDRDRDIEARDKAIEKIENRIDKLFDYITKLIEKI